MISVFRFVFVFLIVPPTVSASNYEDRQRLVDFKNGIWTDPSGLIFNTWIVGDDDPSCPTTWYGVTCDESNTHVVSLAINGLALFGEIDLTSITGMVSLQNLTLSENDLTGAIPSSIGSLVSLRHLDLSRNRFHGSIPDEISHLSNLTFVNLSFNNFTGELPAGIRGTVIDVRSNSLSGEAGDVLSVLTKTEYLDLSENLFSGELSLLPQEVHGLARTVRYLGLSENKIGGRFFPSETMELFENLVFLDVRRNILSGNLPSFAFCHSLRVLLGSDNMFFGPLPVEFFGVLGTVVNLDLSRNRFTGSIPSIESRAMMVLNLSSNALSGRLPSQTGNCTVIDLSGNRLVGNLLNMQGWGSSLEFMDLSSNYLSGKIPLQIYHMKALNYIKLSNNSLEGPLPPALGAFPQLSVVDLSSNKLEDSLLPSLLTAPNLRTLNLHGNLLSGDIQFLLRGVQTKTMMEFLDLSHNSFSGPLLVPDADSLQNLRLLDLRHNSLSGRIPSQLGDLEHLQLLDLSSNRFEGLIPNISQESLTVLNLTHNNLSGPIPRTMARFPDETFYPGNPLLGKVAAAAAAAAAANSSAGNHSEYGGSAGSSGMFADGAQERGSKSSSIRIGAVVGIVAVAAMILVIVAMTGILLIRSHELKFKDQIPRRELKLGKFSSKFFCSPRKSFKESSSSMGFSYDHLVSSPSTSQRRDICELSSFSTVEHPELLEQQVMVLDVDSPERLLIGELHFLNNSMPFTAEELLRAPAEILGRSGYGTSYRAVLNRGRVVTVKLLRPGILKKRKEFTKEIRRIGDVKHPNVISLNSYYCGHSKDQEKLIVYDYVNGENMAVYLQKAPRSKLQRQTFKQRLQVAIDVARCLCFLHQDKGLPHGNLKATNILLCGTTPTAQLTDYGIHNLLTSSGNSELMLNYGALGYRAPELTSTPKPFPTYKTDVYAFGVILMELLTGRSAGEVIADQVGEVDLTDWVWKCSVGGKGKECFDKDLVKEAAPHAMKELLVISLRCILPVHERPNIRTVLEDLLSIAT